MRHSVHFPTVTTASILDGSGGSARARENARPAAIRRLLWLTLGTGLLLGLAFQGSRPLWEPDEARYTAVALNMVRHGEWWIPRLHPEQLHLTKPPVTYWAMGLSMELLGENEWAVRLPNALAFAATAWLVAWMGATLWPRRLPLAGIVYATLLLPVVAAHIATTDTLLTLWETLVVAGFVRARWGPEGRRSGLLLLWLGLGLAFLTKGPPALLSFAAIVLFVLLADGPRGLRRLAPLRGVGLFFLVGLGWYVWAAVRLPGVLEYWLGSEVAGRIFTGMHHRNPGPWGAVEIYLPVLLAGTLPWGWLALRPIGRAFGRVRSLGRAAFRDHGREIFPVLWLLAPLVVFFLARSRLPLYLVPLMAPVALLAASRVGERPPRRWAVAVTVLWAVALVGLKGYAAGYGGDRDASLLAASLPLQEEVEEIVFVDTNPRYGLSFYLDVDIEAVRLEESPLYPFEHTLADELAEPDHRRLFVVRPHVERDLLEAARSAGYRLVAAADWEIEGKPQRVLDIRERRRKSRRRANAV